MGFFSQGIRQKASWDVSRDLFSNTHLICVSNKDKSFFRFISYNGNFVTSQNLKYVAVEDSGWSIFTAIPVSEHKRTYFSAALASGPVGSEGDLKEWAKMRDMLSNGWRVFCRIHRPKINPLNFKTVGPNSNRYKGEGEIVRLTTSDLVARVRFDMISPIAGDVISELRAEHPKFGSSTFYLKWRVLEPYPAKFNEHLNLEPVLFENEKPIESSQTQIASKIVREALWLRDAIKECRAELSKRQDEDIQFEEIKPFLNRDSTVYKTDGKDLMGNAYNFNPVGPEQVFVSLKTVALLPKADANIWSGLIKP